MKDPKIPASIEVLAQELFDLLLDHPDGLTVPQIFDMLGWDASTFAGIRKGRP